MAGKLISDLNSVGTLGLADQMEIDKDVSGVRTSYKTSVKDIVDFANQNFAEEYDSTSSYAVGDYCIYESVLYKCIGTTTGSFDSTKWTSVVVTNEMGSGGGGTGGHTIIDENGNSMTARAGLQFVGGANVSDDSTNNKTIVDLASAGGIDGVFVDTDNLISSGTLSNSGTTSYTATEDCYFIGYSSSGSALAYLIDNVTMIFAPTNQTHSLLLKKGQTLTVGEASTYSISYKIYGIQTGTTHSKFQPVIYSTEEREIGVWTDGKPLYEKTIHTGALSVGEGTKPHNISNFGTLINATGMAYYSGYVLTFPFVSIGQNSWNVGIGGADTNNIITEVGSSFTGNSAITDSYITLQYTKTTDVAGSGTWTPQGVPAVHYSTDEHIIGTWIDGSTLYEKTFYIHDRQFSSSGECDFDVTSLNSDILMADNMASYYTFSISSTEYVRQFEKLVPEEGHVYAYGPANRQIETGYITIRYTKSS